MAINWEEAPADAEIHMSDGLNHWWIKLRGDAYSFIRLGDDRGWVGYINGYADMVVRNGYIETHRPKEAVNMYKAKDIKHTKAYQQLRRCIELSVEDVNKRPYELGQLTKRFLQRVFERHGAGFGFRKYYEVGEAFHWANTPEGRFYWETISDEDVLNDLHPCPIVEGGKKAKAKPAKLPPKAPAVPKRLGWWHV